MLTPRQGARRRTRLERMRGDEFEFYCLGGMLSDGRHHYTTTVSPEDLQSH
jgi:hypothetical protein